MTPESKPQSEKAQHLIPTYCEYINKYVVQPCLRVQNEVPGEHHFVALYLVPRLSQFSFLGVPHFINPDGMKDADGDIVYYSYEPHKTLSYTTTTRLKIEVKLENPLDRWFQLTRSQYYHWIKQEWTPEEKAKLTLGTHTAKPGQPDLFVGVSLRGIVILPWAEFLDLYIKTVYPGGLRDIPYVKGQPSRTGKFPMSSFGWDKAEGSRFYFPYATKLDDWTKLEEEFVKSLRSQCEEVASQVPLKPLGLR